MGAITHSYYEKDKSCQIKVKDDHVMINGKKITDNVRQTTPKDVLFMDKKTRATIQAIEFTTTEPKADKASYFQHYHCLVKSITNCRTAHSAIASIPSVADKSHLISAYTLSSG
jgi:ribosomal protein S4